MKTSRAWQRAVYTCVCLGSLHRESVWAPRRNLSPPPVRKCKSVRKCTLLSERTFWNLHYRLRTFVIFVSQFDVWHLIHTTTCSRANTYYVERIVHAYISKRKCTRKHTLSATAQLNGRDSSKNTLPLTNTALAEHVIGQHTRHHIRTAPTALTATREYHYTRIVLQNRLKRVLRNRITVVTI